MKLIAVCALAILAAVPAAAQDDPAKKPTPKLADGHPDLNGYWATGRGPDTPVNSEFGQPNAIVQAPGMPIVFLYQLGAGNTFRQVPTDTRQHDDIALSIGNMYNGD